MEPTDGDTSDSDELYSQLQDQIDILLGDFNTLVGRNSGDGILT